MAEEGALVTVGGEVDGVPLLFQSLLEESGSLGVILDNENPHPRLFLVLSNYRVMWSLMTSETIYLPGTQLRSLNPFLKDRQS